MLSFKQVNPYCVALSQLTFNIPVDQWDQSKILVQITSLYNIIATDNDPIPTNLIEYLMIPVAKLLIQFGQLNPSINVKLLSILNHFALTSWYDKFNLNLSTNLFPFINHLSQSILDNHTTTHSQILLIVETFKNFTQSIINQPYRNEFFNDNDNKFILLSNLTNLISLQLDILNLHSNNDLYIQSTIITSLTNLYAKCLNFDQGEILSNILPGNVSNLIKSMLKPKLNYKLVTESLNLFQFLIVTVYNDKCLATTTSSLASSSSSFAQTHRTEKWLLATREQVKLAINQCFPILIKRNNLQINQAICQFIKSILLNCFHSIATICQDCFMKYLIQCQFDSFDNLSFDSPDLKSLIHKGEYNYLNELLTSLSSSINLNKIENLKSINFILSHNHSPVVTNHSINQIMSQLIKSTTDGPHSSSIILSGKKKTSNNPNLKLISQSNNVILKDLSVSTSILNSTHIDDDRINNNIWTKDIESEIIELLNKMGKYIKFDPSIIESNLAKLNKLNDLSIQNSILWMILNLLPSETTNEVKNNQLTDITDMFLNINDDEQSPNDVILSSQNNIDDSCLILLEVATNLLQSEELINDFTVLSFEQERLICIVLQIIQRSCELMKENFANELIDYLYLVIGSLASSSPLVRSYAQSSLNTMAKLLYQGSIHNLIVENVDYLIESISQRLNMGMTQHVTSVLMIICKMTGYETILSFNDILETIFQILDYYHGYTDLCLQIFQFFEIVINEMSIKYLTSETNLKLDSSHLTSISFKPWGCTNESQFTSLIESKLHTQFDDLNLDGNDLPFKPNEPKDFQEYFDSKLKIQEINEELDSDDENENENENGTEEETTDSDTIKWVSPIPKESYRLLIQIIEYGDRLLTHNSKSLRVQILKVIKLTIPMLATQYHSLLPQVAQIWDSVTQCLFDKDYSIINSAASTAESIIHFAQDFISRRFIDLWTKLQSECPLLKEVNTSHNLKISTFAKSQRQLSTRIEYPPMTKNALVAISNMLLEGITFTEFILNENTLKDMITCCLSVTPAKIITDRSLLLGDVMCYIQNYS